MKNKPEIKITIGGVPDEAKVKIENAVKDLLEHMTPDEIGDLLLKEFEKKGFKAQDGRGKVCVSDDHELTVTRESFPVRDQGAIGSSVAQAQSAVNEFMHLKETDPDFIYKTKGGEKC